MSKGYGRKSLHLLIEKTYDLKSIPARNKIISEAAKTIQQELNEEEMRTMFLERLESISEKAEESGKFGDAIKAIDSQAKLLGLNVDKSEIKIESENPIFEIKFGDE